MYRLTAAALLALAAGTPAFAQEEKAEKTREEQLQEIQTRHQERARPLVAKFRKSEDDAEKGKIKQEFDASVRTAAEAALKLAEADPTDEVALQAAMFAMGAEGMAEKAEAVIRQIREKASDKALKLQAAFGLAEALRERADGAEDEAAKGKLTAEAEKLYEEVAAGKEESEQMAKMAEGRLTSIRNAANLAVGKVAPEAKAENLAGDQEKLSDYRGKVVMLDIWATWCPPCRAMIPHEREMVERLEGKPFALISVSCDAEKEALTKFLQKEQMPWKHWWDGQGGEVAATFNAEGLPTVYILDAKGVIRKKLVGYDPAKTNEELDETVDALLKEVEGGDGK